MFCRLLIRAPSSTIERLFAVRRRFCGHVNRFASCEKSTGDRIGSATDFCGGPWATTCPPSLSRTGPHVDQLVGLPHHRFVVFHHQHGVAQRLQFAQGLDQSLIVAMVQADRRFVQDVADADQARTDAGGQPHSLQFAAAERFGGAIERQVADADFLEELQCDCGSLGSAAARSRACSEPSASSRKKVWACRDRQPHNLVDSSAVQPHTGRLGSQARTLTGLTGHNPAITLQRGESFLAGRRRELLFQQHQQSAEFVIIAMQQVMPNAESDNSARGVVTAAPRDSRKRLSDFTLLSHHRGTEGFPGFDRALIDADSSRSAGAPVPGRIPRRRPAPRRPDRHRRDC